MKTDKYPNVIDMTVHNDIGWIEVHHDGNIKWETLQKIKNDVWGLETAAIEVYPPESRVVNSGPYRHLWRLGKGEFYPDIKDVDMNDRDMTLAERFSFFKACEK